MRKGNTRFGVLMFMLAFGAWLASPTVGRAQQVPTLDPNFKPVIAVPGGFLTAVAVQTDAKILVAGGFNAINGIARNGLARLNADGSVDSTFDAGSVCCGVGLNSSQGTSPITALCLQPDGKLLAGGYFTNINGVARGGLARLNADGTLDSTFDPGSGLSFVSGAPSVAPVAKFVLQPDGKVLVGGYFSGVNGVGRNGVARLNANGSLDATFNPGSALAIGDPVDAARLTGMAVLTNGQVLLAGNYQSFNLVQLSGLARLNADGTLDSAFNPLISAQTLTPSIDSFLLLSNGQMLISGNFQFINNPAIATLARVNPDGTPDTSFQPTVDTLNGESYTLLAVQPADGKIIVYHQFTDASSQAHNELARLTTNGTLDTTFDLVLQARPADALQVAGAAFQPDGRLLVAGDFYAGTNIAHESIARLDASANVDASLNPSFETGNAPTAVLAVAVQTDNSVIFGGSFSLINGVGYTNLARLNPVGALDTSFAPVLQATSQQNPLVSAILPQKDGKMLIGGSFASVNGTNRNSLARLNSDGSLDSSFDVGSGTGGSGQVEAMAFQPDGKLMVAGNFNLFNGAALSAIVRLQTNGVLDMTFGVFFDSCVDCGFPDLRGVGVLSNGTIMISGVFNRIETAHWNGLARLNPDGGLDITFNPPVGVDEQVSAMVVGKDDKTTVAIQFSDPSGNGNDARFVRLNPDGSPDASFNPAAVIGLSTGIPVSAMALDSQGRLLIAGQFSSVGGVARHGLARLNQDGTLDATFDSGPGFAGGAPQAAPNSTALVSGVALQDNGGIIVGGNFWIADNQVRLGLARFQADQSGQGGGSSTIQSAARAADGTFSMTILGSSGQSYRVDASSDLRTWTPIGSITGTGAPQSFTDPAAKGIPMRFYRLVNQ